MGMLDYMREQKNKKQYVSSETEAQTIFNQQQESIKNIKDTKGLKEIVDYWERQKDLNETMFEQTEKDKDKYFALYKQSKMFLQFIANLLD
jgi:hypothetical protein